MPSTITTRTSSVGTPATPNGENSTVALKVPVVAATTANITLNGTQTIDTVAVVANDRVLVKDQTDATENGVYVVSADDWTRSTDTADVGDLLTGTEVRVNGGTQAGRWYISTTGTITPGTTEVTWAQVTGLEVSDGDKGDITVSSSGTVFTIDDGAVTFAKMVDASAESKLVGRRSGSAGDFEEITLGTGLSMSGTTLNGSSSGSNIVRSWLPQDAVFPDSSLPTLNKVNNHAVLEFQAANDETCYLHGFTPDNYSSGGDLEIVFAYAQDSGTTGNVRWRARLEALDGSALGSDGFGSWVASNDAVPGTAGNITTHTITLTTGNSGLDSIAAGEPFRLNIGREGSNGGDTATGVSRLVAVEMRVG